MPKTRKPCPPEFRQQMVELVRAGRTPYELSKEFELTARTIASWVVQADLDDGLRTDGLTTAEKEELKRLCKEKKQLRMEREMMAKAAVWFAQEIDSIPPKSSGS